MGASRPITITTGASPALVVGGAGRIVFSSVAETSLVSPGGFTLFDGNPTTQYGVLIFTLNAAGSARDSYAEHGVPFEGDLWIGGATGALTAILHVVPEDLWERWREDYWRGFEKVLMAAGGI